MKIKIPNAEVQHLLVEKEIAFPKYTTQIMNLANGNSKGTALKIVTDARFMQFNFLQCNLPFSRFKFIIFIESDRMHWHRLRCHIK